MNNTYKNMLFDLDGTLTDSAAGVTGSVRYALDKLGIDAGGEDLSAFIGPPLQQSFQKRCGLDRARAEEAVEYYRDYYRSRGIYENRVYPGIPEMLESLRAEGAELYVATSKPTFFAEKVIRHFNLDRFFLMVAGSNLDGTGSEKSEVIGSILSAHRHLDQSETVMVGDRKHDINGARSCGIDSIAVTYGYGSENELSASSPTFMVNSVAGLGRLLLNNARY